MHLNLNRLSRIFFPFFSPQKHSNVGIVKKNMVECGQEEAVGLRFVGQLSIRRSQALPLGKNVIIGCRIFFFFFNLVTNDLFF